MSTMKVIIENMKSCNERVAMIPTIEHASDAAGTMMYLLMMTMMMVMRMIMMTMIDILVIIVIIIIIPRAAALLRWRSCGRCCY